MVLRDTTGLEDYRTMMQQTIANAMFAGAVTEYERQHYEGRYPKTTGMPAPQPKLWQIIENAYQTGRTVEITSFTPDTIIDERRNTARPNKEELPRKPRQ